MQWRLVVSFFILLYTNVSSAQVIAPGAKLQLIDSSFAFAEGPAADRSGNVYFTDQPNDNIWLYDTSGKLSLYLHNTRRANGMYFDGKGNLVACADEKNELISISRNKKISVLTNGYKGHVLNGPNDVWINRTNGDMYITDPYFQRDYWTRRHADSALGGEHLYYLPSGSSALVLADSSLKKPNGIVGTPDGRYLYVADMGDWKTYRYEIRSDGSLYNKQLFVKEASDGMTIDNHGNIYLTNNGVKVYDSTSQKILQIDVPEKWTGNLCFGGSKKNILFITASKSVYIVRMQVHGVE
jgi:gluconolactonase